MENMEDEPPATSPFWVQPTTTGTRHRLLFPSSANFLTTGFFVVILCISAIVFLALVIPSILSFTHQVFKPSSVRKGWDSLNLVLVVFAVVCGFLGRRNYEDQRDQDLLVNTPDPSSPLRPHQQFNNWYDFNYEVGDLNEGVVTKLRRTSSSYPDLRQEIEWDLDYDHRPRYYDDSFRPPRSLKSFGSFRSGRGMNGEEEADVSTVKQIEMDSSSIRRAEEELAPPPLPPTPPMYYSRRVRKTPRKECESIGRRGRKGKESTPPPSPSTPIPKPKPWEDARTKSANKRKSTIVKRKSNESLIDLPIVPKHIEFEDVGGYESPTIIGIPPPPPPPPFKLPPWKFVVEGDYIKITNSPKRGGKMEFSEFEESDSSPMAKFCASPDVNTKADDFIARFKATLKA